MIPLAVLVIAYLLGAIPFGYVLVKWKTGADVRAAATPESAPTPPGDASANSRYRPGSGRKPLSAPKWRVCVLYVPTSHFQLYDIDRKSTRLNSSHLGISY